MIMTGKIKIPPFTDHHRFDELYSRYAESVNSLGDKMEEAEIDIDELNEVIDATCAIERLDFRQFLKKCEMGVIIRTKDGAQFRFCLFRDEEEYIIKISPLRTIYWPIFNPAEQ